MLADAVAFLPSPKVFRRPSSRQTHMTDGKDLTGGIKSNEPQQGLFKCIVHWETYHINNAAFI